MANTPCITIGMPVFNGEKTISDAIKSVIEQDFEDWTLLISDNFSTDSTWDICKTFAAQDSRILIIRQNENIGGWANFNFVLNQAKTKYFKFQAADDVISKDFIRVNLVSLEKFAGLIGSTSNNLWDWESELDLKATNFQLFGSQSERFKTLRKNYRELNGLFYGIFRLSELKNVVTEDLFQGTVLELDWLILAKLLKTGNISRCPDGVMILNSNGASNSNPTAWFNPHLSVTATLFPYLKFLRLIRRGSPSLNLSSVSQIIFWIAQLQMNHFKGLLWYFMKIHTWRR
jgi:glycosyltransferase involved in cell wall biosynthesis